MSKRKGKAKNAQQRIRITIVARFEMDAPELVERAAEIQEIKDNITAWGEVVSESLEVVP